MNDPINWVDPTGLTQQDADIAMAYLATVHPELVQGLNPTVSNGWVPSILGDALTLSPNNIRMDMDRIDAQTCGGSTARIADYISLLSHELMHAQDMRNGSLSNLMSSNRHENIYDRAARITLRYRSGN